MRVVPPLSDDQKSEVIAAARTLLTARKHALYRFQAVPFRHQGRTLRGMDCIGVLVYAFGKAGFVLNDRTDYGRLPANRKLAASMVEHFGEALPGPYRMEDLRPGDLVTMSWGAEECHVALIVDHPYGIGMLHAYNSAQRVVEHRVDDLVLKRITAVYRP